MFGHARSKLLWDFAELAKQEIRDRVDKHDIDCDLQKGQLVGVHKKRYLGWAAKVSTKNGTVTANFVVLACNGYLGKLEARVASKIMPINNFIVATEPLGQERCDQLISGRYGIHDTRFVVNYFRLSKDHRLLFGGGQNYRAGFPKDIAAFVRPYMLEIFPQLADVAIEYAWGGTLLRYPGMVLGMLYYGLKDRL